MEDVSDFRKNLKLLMLTNMKMKKQLKSSLRIRFWNNLRLEDDIVKLNNFVDYLKCLTQEDADKKRFSNPVKLKEFLLKDYNLCLPPTKQIVNKNGFNIFCDKCSFKSKKRASFQIHLRRHNNVKLYPCEECPLAFVTPAELMSHSHTHQKGKLYPCDLCSFSTRNTHGLVAHKMRMHFSGTDFQCNQCHFQTPDRQKWREHRSSNPSHRTDTQCKACKAARKTILDNSKKDKNAFFLDVDHSCGKKWRCSLCGLLFKRRDSLKKHTVIHSSEKNYKCDICDYTTAFKNSLIIHTRTHSGEKPFKCDHCPFSCTTRSYLTVHTNIHKGIKPYKCHLCPFRSADSSKISAHRKKVHENVVTKGKRGRTGNKFMCKHCGRLLHTAASLLGHEQEHSGDQ